MYILVIIHCLQDSLLLLMLPALGEVKPPGGDGDARKAAFLGLKDRPGAAREGEQTDRRADRPGCNTLNLFYKGSCDLLM